MYIYVDCLIIFNKPTSSYVNEFKRGRLIKFSFVIANIYICYTPMVYFYQESALDSVCNKSSFVMPHNLNYKLLGKNGIS